MTITNRDMKFHVEQALGVEAAGFDVESIVDEMRETFGLVDLKTVEGYQYWEILFSHRLVDVEHHADGSESIREGLGASEGTAEPDHSRCETSGRLCPTGEHDTPPRSPWAGYTDEEADHSHCGEPGVKCPTHAHRSPWDYV